MEISKLQYSLSDYEFVAVDPSGKNDVVYLIEDALELDKFKARWDSQPEFIRNLATFRHGLPYLTSGDDWEPLTKFHLLPDFHGIKSIQVIQFNTFVNMVLDRIYETDNDLRYQDDYL